MNSSEAKSEKRAQQRAEQRQYHRELTEQIENKKAATEKEEQEREKREVNLEREIQEYDPWGKDGGGAPVRNNDGKVVADLKTCEKDEVNLEREQNSDNSSDKTEPMTTTAGDLSVDNTTLSHKRCDTFVRGLQCLVKSPRDMQEQNTHKAFLLEQVEERKRNREELKETERIEDDKANRKLAAQQQCMRDEYEADNKEKVLQYHRDLTEQIETKKAMTEKEKQEREKHEVNLEREIQEYDPWGKAGGGAPVRNNDGKVVADLKTCEKHEVKLEIKQNRNNSSDKTEPMTTTAGDLSVDNTSPSHKRCDTFVRELQCLVKSPRDMQEQNTHKAFLLEQVEERKRNREELKETERIEDDKANRKLAAQQQCMRDEYEADNKEKVLQYHRDLTEQIETKKAMTEKEKQEREKHEVNLEREIQEYDPWGKAGGGAPVRNNDGVQLN